MFRSRHAWWLYLALITPVAVGYLAGPFHAGPVYNAIGFSAIPAMVIGVRMHRPTRPLGVVRARVRRGAVRRRRRARLQLHGDLRDCAAVGLDRGCLLSLVLSGHRRRAAAADQEPQPGARLGEPDRRGDCHDRSRTALVARPDRAAGGQRGAAAGNEAGLDRLSALGHPRPRRRGAAGRRPRAPQPRLLHDRRSARRRPRGGLRLRLEPAARRVQPRNTAGRRLDRSAPAVRSRGAASLDDDGVSAGARPSRGSMSGGW